MAKSFKTQLNPTFKSAVKIPRVGGDPLDVTFTFKTFDRTKLAAIFDNWKKESIALLEASQAVEGTDQAFNLTEWTERELEVQVRQIKDVVVGWGFDDEFTDENIKELLNSSISVTDVILSEYNEAYTRARQGN